MSDDYQYSTNNWTISPQSLTIAHPQKGEFRVQNKVMQVLICLLEADNQVVNKQTLLDQVWQDTAITENSLNQAISELRKVFSDSRSMPQFIETVPRKGYRFIPAASKFKQPSNPIPAKVKSNQRKSIQKRFSPILGSVSLLLIVLFLKYSMDSTDSDNLDSDSQRSDNQGSDNQYSNNQSAIETNLNPNTPKIEIRRKLQVAPNGQAIAFFKETSEGVYLHVQFNDENIAPVVTFIRNPESLVLGWSNDSDKVIYNASQSTQPFYAINVLEIDSGQTRYYKAAKDSTKHAKDSLPEGFDKPIQHVNHEEILLAGDRIEKIQYDENEYFSVYFEADKIKSFSWLTSQT